MTLRGRLTTYAVVVPFAIFLAFPFYFALVAVLFGIVFTAVDFAVVYILTRGGPFNSTQVLPTWAYFVGIDGGSLGAGAAISLFLFPLLVVVTVAMLFFARRAQVT